MIEAQSYQPENLSSSIRTDVPISTELQTQEYGLPLLENVAVENHIELYPNFNQEMDKLDNIKNTLKKRDSVPPEVKKDSALHEAGAFYNGWIKPWIATGSDAFKPGPDDITQLCRDLASGQEVNMVLYYALSKTQSPNRTGSPNTVIDFAELEMLGHEATVTGVAQRLGFTLNVALLDETTALPKNGPMGFNEQDVRTNMAIARAYLDKAGVGLKVNIRSLADSVQIPLGDRYQTEYDARFQGFADQIYADTQQGIRNAETVRALIFLDCMSNDGLKTFGFDDAEVNKIRASMKSVDQITQLPEDLQQYLIGLTAHMKTVMDLRSVAAQTIKERGDLELYPEYSDKRLYGGVTRSKSRWSFLPVPQKLNGNTRNPMHGLAFYGNHTQPREFKGFMTFAEANAANQEQESVKILTVDQKPVAVVSL